MAPHDIKVAMNGGHQLQEILVPDHELPREEFLIGHRERVQRVEVLEQRGVLLELADVSA